MPLITELQMVPQTHVKLDIRVRFTTELFYKKKGAKGKISETP